ncbi:hypothetical protein C8F01DRAFT_1346354 [Mycena amicta]|nr:hypothetical protein C8F01DRAFT_1346354 [Mycena amicta]
MASRSSRSFLLSEDFDPCWKWVRFLIARKIAEALVYALSMAFLSFAIFTLYHRGAKVANTRVWLICSYIMVLMGTVQVILNFLDLALSLSILERMDITLADICTSSTAPWDAGSNATQRHDVGIVGWFLFVVNVAFADTIFVRVSLAQASLLAYGRLTAQHIYRCYLLWGDRWKVLLAPGVLLVATTVTGIIVSLELPGIDGRVPFILAFSTNVVLVGLSAGRIISIRRSAVSLGSVVLQSRYSTVLAVIVESGALYCFIVISVVLARTIHGGYTVVYYAATGAACHAVNIVPTLVLVRTGLGYSMNHLKANKGASTERLIFSEV